MHWDSGPSENENPSSNAKENDVQGGEEHFAPTHKDR